MKNQTRTQPQFSCPFLSSQVYEAVSLPMSHVDNDERGVKAILKEYGFCVVTDVMSREECKALEGILSNELLSLIDVESLQQTIKNAMTMVSDKIESSPPSKTLLLLEEAWKHVQNDGVQAWPDGTLQQFGIKNRFQLRGMPHSQFAWDCRRHANIQTIYQLLHNTTDLVSSCDNPFVSNAATSRQETNVLWPHVDLNDHDPLVSNWDVYQGLLYIWSSESDHSSTTVIWPKSHQPDIYQHYMHDDGLRRRALEKQQHFTPLHQIKQPSVDRNALHQGWMAHARRIPVPAGALLLWSSRTTHQGWSGGPRLAQPVCWEPRHRRLLETQYRKWALAALGLPSTHWASLGQPHHLVRHDQPLPVMEARDHAEDVDAVVLPLKQYLPSVALKDHVDPAQLWTQLGGGRVRLDRPLPTDVVTLLDACLKEEFKSIL